MDQGLNDSLKSERRSCLPTSLVSLRYSRGFASIRGFSLHGCGLETSLAAVLRDHLLQAANIFLLLSFEIAPEILEVDLPLRIRDILVVTPERIEPLAQLVDHVVVVIGRSLGFADVGEFFFSCQAHGGFLR